jgi:hypothetical protein
MERSLARLPLAICSAIYSADDLACCSGIKLAVHLLISAVLKDQTGSPLREHHNWLIKGCISTVCPAINAVAFDEN